MERYLHLVIADVFHCATCASSARNDISVPISASHLSSSVVSMKWLLKRAANRIAVSTAGMAISLLIRGERIRIPDIDAAESRQTCIDTFWTRH